METAILVALISAVALLLGHIINKQGTKAQLLQAEAANKLLERQEDWKRRGEIIEDLERERERLKKRLITAQTNCYTNLRYSTEVIEMLQKIVRDETAQEIGLEALERIAKHLGEDHV